MLEPQTRQLLLDALRPPDDYSLDFAVGTTYSLDLLALLTAPLGFTRFELLHSEGSDIADADAHILLRTIREFADKITIFCQAGRIAVPRGQRPLLSALEDMVVEVTPSVPGRVFHPKVWALRFIAEDEPVRYRLLVLSRNLTFAAHWDTVLVLDGELQERSNAIRANHPLGAFFGYLPDLAVRGTSPAVKARIDSLQSEIRKVKFECPDGIEEIAFHPLGIPEVRGDPFDQRIERIAIVSPFITSTALAELSEEGKNDVLVSRLDSLQKLSAQQLRGFGEVYSMDPAAAVNPEQGADARIDPFGEGSGLHAKLYVGNDGWDAHVWTGSANATTAAFNGNVEFLVRLKGKRSTFGVDALLGRQEGTTNFRDLLVRFEPLSTPIEENPIDAELDDLLEQTRTEVAAAPWTASASASEMSTFDLRLRTEKAPRIEWSRVQINVYPMTLNASRQVGIDESCNARFEGVSTEAITSFFVFEICASIEESSRSCQFVVNATLEGAPSNRREVLLRSMLRDKKQLIRFLLLLLDDVDDGIVLGSPMAQLGANAGPVTSSSDVQVLLEPLLRALDREPTRLDQVARLLSDLGDGSDILPDGLREVFAPIWEARQGLAL